MSIVPFGVNYSARSPAAAAAGPKQAEDFGGRFPWVCLGDGEEQESPEFLICNLALGDIRNNLRAMLTMEGRVHVETYLAATGVLAGFAAQRALFDRLSELSAKRRVGQVMMATTRASEKFFFGDMLNDALIARRDEEKRLKVWPLAFDAAISAGMRRASAPQARNSLWLCGGQISEPFYPSADARARGARERPAHALLAAGSSGFRRQAHGANAPGGGAQGRQPALAARNPRRSSPRTACSKRRRSCRRPRRSRS